MTKQNKRLGTEKNPAFNKVHIWFHKDVFFFVIVFCSFYQESNQASQLSEIWAAIPLYRWLCRYSELLFGASKPQPAFRVRLINHQDYYTLSQYPVKF
jgi:hypothetical protein